MSAVPPPAPRPAVPEDDRPVFRVRERPPVPPPPPRQAEAPRFICRP